MPSERNDDEELKSRARLHLEGLVDTDVRQALQELEHVDDLDPALEFSAEATAALYCATFGPCGACVEREDTKSKRGERRSPRPVRDSEM